MPAAAPTGRDQARRRADSLRSREGVASQWIWYSVFLVQSGKHFLQL